MSPLFEPCENGEVLYVPVSADFNIASITPVIIVNKSIPIEAGDKIHVETFFTVQQNSGAPRILTLRITIAQAGAFTIEFQTGSLATSATLIHPFHLRTVFDIRSTSLAYQVAEASGFTAAGIGTGANPTMAATMLSAMGWEEDTDDYTGNKSIQLAAWSAAAIDTQILRLHHFAIRKYRTQL